MIYHSFRMNCYSSVNFIVILKISIKIMLAACQKVMFCCKMLKFFSYLCVSLKNLYFRRFIPRYFVGLNCFYSKTVSDSCRV